MTGISSSTPGRRAWVLLVIITLLNTVGMTIVIPVLPFIVQEMVPQGSLALWVGILESVSALCAFLVAPLLGGLSDRVGRRPVIIVSAFGAAVAALLFGWGDAIWILVLARIVQGLTAGDMPALFAYVADITPPEHRAKRYGFLGALSGIGFMIGPAAGGLLASIDLRAPLFAMAAVAFTVALVALFALPESLAPENRSARLKIAELHPFRVLRTAFGRPELRGLLVGYTLLAIPFTFFTNNFTVVALDTVGWTAAQAGLVISAVGVLDIAVQGGLLPLLLPRIGERGVVIAGIVTQALGCLGIAIAASLLPLPWLVISGALVLAAGQGGTSAALNGVMSASVGAHEQGWLAGGVSSIGSAVQMVAPLAAGFLTRRRAMPRRTGWAPR